MSSSLAEARTRAWYERDFWRFLINHAKTIIPRSLRSHLAKTYFKLPYSWRSDTFRRMCKFLEKSQLWDRDRLVEYQFEKLRAMIEYAARNVPAYAMNFAEYGVDASKLKSLEDIRKFPCLTKEELRERPGDYIAQNIAKENLTHVTSGGTSGAPVGFYHLSKYNADVAAAFRFTMWRRIGYRWNSRVLDLTASLKDPMKYSADRRSLHLSIASLGHQQFARFRDEIWSFQPEFVVGFPSTLTLFAQLAKDYSLEGLEVKGVISASEVMYSSQRNYISDVLACRILEWYGLAEYCGFASGCEYGDEFHFFPEAGLMEIVGEDGAPVREEGAQGEILLTGFHNWATPFIRYRTGDRGILGRSGCGICRRHYPLVQRILGRTQEFLVARNGRLIPNTALNVHSGIFDHVVSYQFYQDAPGEVVLNIVRKPSYPNGYTQRIREEIEMRLGEDVSLEICFVEEIAKTAAGKHRFIVQKLPLTEIPLHCRKKI